MEIDAEGELLYWLNDGNGFRWLKIADHRFFGVLCAGVKVTKGKKQDYSRLDISIGDSVQGNLQNKSVNEYQNIVANVMNYLADEYGVFVELETVKLGSMEINCTFEIDEEFFKYHRVLHLMMFLLPKSYKKVRHFLDANTQLLRYETETFYRGNTSMEVKIYDKRKHLAQTVGVITGAELMRIEIILKNPQKIREVFKTSVVWELTDGMLNDFYWKQFSRLFIRPYRKWQTANRKMLRDKIQYHKEKSSKLWKNNLLAECSNREQLDQLPWLLDVNDLLEQIRALEKGSHYNRVAKGVIEACKSNDVYLQNDSSKMEEIFNKVHQVYLRYNGLNRQGIHEPTSGKVA